MGDCKALLIRQKTMEELKTKVLGKDLPQYMADLLERNEKQQIEIDRGKLSVSILKQMNNHARLVLDSKKFELKRKEFELKNNCQSPILEIS